MAVLFENKSDQPQTHVLLIGVGGYRYLNGGSEEKTQTFDGAQNLRQLTSPAKSVEALYKTIMALDRSKAWIKPLGSIDVLVSPAPANGPVLKGHHPEPATKENITQAYWRWREKCNQHLDNVALFYFCGHGLEKGEQYLLAEDFGRIPGNPWTESFVFDSTRRAFHTCRASTQIFLIDSCRKITSDMLTTALPNNPLEPPNLLAADCLYNLTQRATAVNEGAYGVPHKPSFYAQALVAALKGEAASNEGNGWKVSTSNIASKMHALLQRNYPEDTPSQRCINLTSDSTEILSFRTPPAVILDVRCTPEEALGLAGLLIKHPNAPTTLRQRAPQPVPWQVKLPAGIYQVQASFPGKEYRNQQDLLMVQPPFSVKLFKCIKS